MAMMRLLPDRPPAAPHNSACVFTRGEGGGQSHTACASGPPQAPSAARRLSFWSCCQSLRRSAQLRRRSRCIRISLHSSLRSASHGQTDLLNSELNARVDQSRSPRNSIWRVVSKLLSWHGGTLQRFARWRARSWQIAMASVRKRGTRK